MQAPGGTTKWGDITANSIHFGGMVSVVRRKRGHLNPESLLILVSVPLKEV
jgi:hypothetical protein